MKEKELRLALVCYGGISLAIYMHGVVKDILKLARASRAYHSVPDVAARQDLDYADLTGEAERRARETDTEAVYFDILKTVGRRLDLRVIVDVIAGASAGGINGIFLARALAHDLSMESLRDMWLTKADVTELLAPDRKARAWSKWVLHPAIWLLTRARLRRMAPDRETRAKLSIFLRSRWFRPPFSGPNMTAMLYEAFETMDGTSGAEASLVPAGQKLDLFVTLTDFFGYARHIPMHDPPVVTEREHRQTLRFSYERRPSGRVATDLDDDSIPALAFAARATSSFPGAFPPAQFSEVDHILRERGLAWKGRDRFLERNFAHVTRGGGDPEKTSFVDGSVLNNKPFYEAIQAIRERSAFRQVDRRLVYIDPDPTQPPPPPDGRVPGFFRTLKDALSDIPRNEPVYDDLALVSALNRKARRLRIVIEAARPRVVELVRSVLGETPRASAGAADIARRRDAANAAAAREAGFAYEGYVRLKLILVIEGATRLIVQLNNCAEDSEDALRIATTIDDWARSAGVYPEDIVPPQRSLWRWRPKMPAWVEFLQHFDADYRRRRLRFVIRALNLLYPRLGEGRFAGVGAEHLDAVKARLYSAFDKVRQADAPERIDAATVASLQAVFAGRPTGGTPDPAPTGTPPDGESNGEAETGSDTGSDAGIDAGIDGVIDALARDLDLAGADAEIDRLFADIGTDASLGAVREELMLHYIGFAFWDVLTFAIANRRDMGEFDEIRVDRISPDDCRSIRQGGAAAMLKGIELNHFAAFFSRGNRENDYLWGRLHAAERLIDILADTAKTEDAAAGLDVKGLKKRAFLAILDTEERHLANSTGLIASLRDEIARI